MVAPGSGRHGPTLRSMQVNDLALGVVQWSAGNLTHSMLQIGLSSALFGMLTSLAAVALFFLIRARPTAMRVLLPSTLLLYLSTALYMAAKIWHISSIDAYVSGANRGLFVASYGQEGHHTFERDVEKQSWMFTVALGINVVLGDTIVWWRACVVWRHRFVYCLGAILLSVTVVCGSLGIYFTPHSSSMNAVIIFRGNRFATASTVLSFATNVLATSLIGYKAWEHRQLLRKHLCEGQRQTRVLRVLALLVESGAIYYALLAAVIVDQIVNGMSRTESSMSPFQAIERDYTYDCFVPIVAIYPVLIIALIALNQSPIDSGFSQPAASSRLGTQRVAGVMTSTVVFHHPGTTGYSSSSDASSIEGGLPVGGQHDGPRGRPPSRSASMFDKDAEQQGEGQGHRAGIATERCNKVPMMTVRCVGEL